MVTAAISQETSARSERRWRIVTWIATILVCIYVLWTGATLYYSTRTFIDLFIGMNLELRGTPRMLVAGYQWLYPIWFGGAVILVAGKQFFVREKAINLTITFAAAITIAVLSGQVVRVLYQPIFDMANKLHK